MRHIIKKILYEQTYLRRRISPSALEAAFENALDHCTNSFLHNKKTWENMEGITFIRLVTQILMDNLHQVLLRGNPDGFPYEQIRAALQDKYQKRILNRFLFLKGFRNKG